MGIKGLPKLINDVTKGKAVRDYNFSRMKGMKVAVDASLIIHKTVIAMRSCGRDMKNKEGELTSHLHGIFYKILKFLQNGMVPIFVFDGKAHAMKSKTLVKREMIKAKAEKKLDNLSDSDDEEYVKAFKQTFRPTKNNMLEAQILLSIMGIPFIIAPGEADVICSWLSCRTDDKGKRYVKGVCSDDSDMLPLGTPYLFKDTLCFMKDNKKIRVISLKETLKGMKLDMNQFVDLCVLLGTDYCDNIRGVGPRSAYKLIVKHKTLENVLNSFNESSDSDDESNETNDEEFLETKKCMIKAKKYFNTALEDIDNSGFTVEDDQLELRKFQEEELMDFMCVKHNFDVTKILTAVNRLKEYYEAMNVTRENNKKVHTILHPRSEKYVIRELSDEIDFLSSESEGSDESDQD